MKADRAIVLFSHGSREKIWLAPIERIERKISARLDEKTVCVSAFLERSAPDIFTCVEELTKSGVGSISVIPIFISVGRHWLNQFPSIQSELRRQFPGATFRWADVIGEWEPLQEALAEMVVDFESTGRGKINPG